MKRAWLVGGVCLAFVPLVLVGLLVLAIKWPRMDAMTRQMPDSFRTTVAAGVLQGAEFGAKSEPALQRVLKLDPDNGQAWGRTCRLKVYGDTPKAALEPCERAVGSEGDAGAYYDLALAQEANNQECDAADTFLKSSQRNSTGIGYLYMQGMGRAALRCGKDPYLAQAGLQGAIDLAAKEVNEADPEDDDLDDAKSDLALDRQYFAVVEGELKDPKAKAAACTAVNPKWTQCACKLNDKGEPECSGA